MYVLGLNTSFHDTAACLVKDGRIVVAIEEERLSREKHTRSFPMRAIRYCLNFAKIDFADIDLIVQDLFEDTDNAVQAWMDLIEKEWGAGKSYKNRLIHLRHHMGHAAAAYYCSGFKDSVILTTDGGGSRGLYKELFMTDRMREREVFWRGKGREIFEISTLGSPEYGNEKPFPPSIGHVYEMACDLLGYGPLEGPGKVMGLSSYGTGKFKRDFKQHYIEYPNGHWIYKDKDIGFEQYRRTEHCPITRDHEEIAYMVQKEIECAMVSMAHYLYQITGSKNLCIGGGVGLNCVANKQVLDKSSFEKIFLFPACADSGLAVGNALYGYFQILKGPNEPEKLATPYFGMNYSTDDVKKSLEEFSDKINYEYEENENKYLSRVAREISNGKIIGWFHGGSEMGPRALGHRSIIADARKKEMKDILNYRVKHREPFRPFAPSVPVEFAAKYFNIDVPSPYMLLVADVLPEMKEVIPSVTHVDGTARVQTLSEKENGIYYRLAIKFGEQTGVYVILNTSFNVAGEPIVEKPIDAVRCFLNTDMDSLAMEQFLITKK